MLLVDYKLIISRILILILETIDLPLQKPYIYIYLDVNLKIK